MGTCVCARTCSVCCLSRVCTKSMHKWNACIQKFISYQSEFHFTCTCLARPFHNKIYYRLARLCSMFIHRFTRSHPIIHIGFTPRDSGKSPQRFPGSPRPDRRLSLQKAHLMKSWHISLRTAALILVDLVCPHLWNNFPVIAILCSCMHSVSNYFVRR